MNRKTLKTVVSMHLLTSVTKNMRDVNIIHHNSAASMISSFKLEMWRCHNKSSDQTATVVTCKLRQSILWQWGQLIVTHTVRKQFKISMCFIVCFQWNSQYWRLVVFVTHLQMRLESGGSALNRRVSLYEPFLCASWPGELRFYNRKQAWKVSK